MIKITKENFKEEVVDCKEPVLIDFWASWCDPCNMLSPIIGEIDSEVSGVKVILIIDHILRTVETNDKIAILTWGSFEECGTHEELMQNDKLYRHIVELQTDTMQM